MIKLDKLHIFIVGIKKNYRGVPLEKALKELSLQYENYWSIDGKNLSEDSIQILSNQIAPLILTNHAMSKGELCCAIAHWEIYNIISERNIEWALILEDDTSLIADPTSITDLLNSIKEPTILNLNSGLRTLESGLSKREVRFLVNSNDARVIELVQPRLQTFAYIINNSAASLIVKRKFKKRKITFRADWPIEIYPGIRFYVATKPFFTHDEGRFNSIISTDRYVEDSFNKKILLKILRSKLSKYFGLTFIAIGINGVNFKSLLYYMYIIRFVKIMNLKFRIKTDAK